jgi:hypothetical protein
MNPQNKVANKPDIARILPIQYIAINRMPQAKKFIVDFGKMPASSMSDLQMKMASIVKQFGDQAKKELAKIHPDTEWIMKAMANGSKMEGGITDNEFVSAHGKNCTCPKCVGMENHSNFVTNYRSDVDSPLNNNVMELSSAEGDSDGDAIKVKKGFGQAAILLSVLALGVIIIASGERHRSYN